MKRNVVIKGFVILFLLMTITCCLNIVDASTIRLKDGICRFHDVSWSSYNDILTTIMWMDNYNCYCLDYARSLSPNSSSYKVKNTSVSSKLQYIVMNGYPAKDLGLGSDDMNYAATQLAVWYFSKSTNGNKLDLNNLRANGGYENYASKTIAKARQLISAANTYGNSYTIPTVSLTVDSSSATKKTSGNNILIGPYRATLKNGDNNNIRVSISGSTSGCAIVDKNGNGKTTFTNSEPIYVRVPASVSGNISIKFDASSKQYAAKVYSTGEGHYTTGPGGVKRYYQDQLVVIPKTVSLSKTVSTNWQNVNGNLTVIKKGEDGTLLAGVKFQLYNSKNTLVSTKITNQEGIAVFSNLAPGSYYVVEKSTVAGYILDSRKVNVTIKSNQTTETTVINKKVSAALKIKKVDNIDKEPIKGAVFEILNSKGKVIQTITTDKDGIATSSNLEYGKYYYREKSVPNSYVLDTKKYEFSISSPTIVEKTVVNEVKKGSITINKVDGETKTPLKGAKFEVYDSKGTKIATLTTNSKGVAQIKDLAIGAYTIKEVAAPKGYKLDDEVYDLTLSKTNLEITKAIYNYKEEVKTGSLKILKIDEDTSAPIAGVKFELYDAKNNLIDTLITDSDGIIFVEKLPQGDYYYKEIEAPGNYVVNDTLKKFSINEENLAVEITVKNKEVIEELFGSLEILKVGDVSDEPLQGVKFELYDSEGNLIGTLVTGADGKANCSNLKVGAYTLKEVETVEGYRMSTEFIDFEISEANLEVSLKVVNMKDRLVQTGDFFSTDMLIVINVSVICTVVFIILKKKVLV